MDKAEFLRKELTGLISEEIRALFAHSPDLSEKIQAIEEEGYSIDVTIVTAVTVTANSRSNKKISTTALTENDLNFLQSMKLTF